jgi:hypothetical protein
MKHFEIQDLPFVTTASESLVWADVEAYVQSHIASHLQDSQIEKLMASVDKVKELAIAEVTVHELCEALFFVQRLVKNNGLSETPESDIRTAVACLDELRSRQQSTEGADEAETDQFTLLISDAIKEKMKNITG